jgi:hypothetical protein
MTLLPMHHAKVCTGPACLPGPATYTRGTERRQGGRGRGRRGTPRAAGLALGLGLGRVLGPHVEVAVLSMQPHPREDLLQ